MAMSWHAMMEFEPPLVGCVISNRNDSFGLLKATKECVISIPTVQLAAKHNFFILEVLRAWVDTSRKSPRTIHHLGMGAFMVAGRTIKLPSRMK
jgi:flavin reductase (DIM6/NTAB) family NADH-FMN oxidoreductase RutF